MRKEMKNQTLSVAWELTQSLSFDSVFKWGDWSLYNTPSTLFVRTTDGKAYMRVRNATGWDTPQEITWPFI